MKRYIAIFLSLIAVSAAALDQSSAVSARTILKAETSWDGKQIQYPSGKPEVTGMLVEIAPGSETGWHSHSSPSFAMMLEGELQVRLKDGRTKTIKAGEALAEVVDKLHSGKNVGSAPVRLVVFYVGVAGQSLSRKEGSD